MTVNQPRLRLIAAVLVVVTLGLGTATKVFAWDDVTSSSQSTSIGWVTMEAGWRWFTYTHQGLGRTSGSPAYSSTFDFIATDSMSLYTSCDNGQNWSFVGSGGAHQLSGANTTSLTNTSSGTIPACNSSPKYKVSTPHRWEDVGTAIGPFYYDRYG
jgi:hypothetical protein